MTKWIDFHIHAITPQMLEVPWYAGLLLRNNPGLFNDHEQFPLTPEQVVQEMDGGRLIEIIHMRRCSRG